MLLKKFISLLFCASLAFSLCACGEKTYEAPLDCPQAVATLTLYAFDGASEAVFGLPNLGHSFVSVKNISPKTLDVGDFPLEKSGEVSVGTWGQNAHWGVWYNLEASYMTISRYKGIISLSQDITADELDTLTAYIKANDTWTPFRNCSYFALDMWNAASTKPEAIPLSGIITPTRVAKHISQTASHKFDRIIPSPSLIAYQDTASATLTAFTLKK